MGPLVIHMNIVAFKSYKPLATQDEHDTNEIKQFAK